MGRRPLQLSVLGGFDFSGTGGGVVNDGTHQLPESSRNALIRMADAMREGFTGRFEVDVNQGSVGDLREVRRISAKELRDDAA